MAVPARIGAVARTRVRRPAPDAPAPHSAARIGRAARCALLQPTGPQRRVAVARAPLADVRAAAHEHSATVNDVLLAAIAGALHVTLRERGEHVPALLVAVPMAERRSTNAQALGNRFREVRAVIPSIDEPWTRLERVAGIMQVRKRFPMGPSVSLIASAVVRAATAVHLYGWYMRRQRYLHTVVTDLHGPDEAQTFCGAPIVEIVPLAVGGGGNVTVTFAALSYAGTLEVSVTVDPDCLPDLVQITARLQAELDRLLPPRRA
jgi:diacylglycerol O-acyltransferase / wax synthase